MFKVGDSYEYRKIVSEEDVVKFAELSGDCNPIHLNDEIAKKSIFGQKICHGMLLGSYISTVLGMYFPGEGTIYLSQNLKFLKPVYVNSQIAIKVVVKELKKKDILILDTQIYVDEVLVVDGNATVKVSINNREMI